MNVPADLIRRNEAAIHLRLAERQVEQVLRGEGVRPVVRTFFDEPTFTATYVVHDPATKAAAIVDSVMDFDKPRAGPPSKAPTGSSITSGRGPDGRVAAGDPRPCRSSVGRALSPGKARRDARHRREILTVQNVFGKIFNEGTEFARDGSQFDRLFADGDSFSIGGIPAIALHVPGHTPADMAYVIGDAAFIGDTHVHARLRHRPGRFPGRRRAPAVSFDPPADARCPTRPGVFLCHDYKAPNRDEYVWETTIGAERTGNVHVHEGVERGRVRRDAQRARRDAGHAAADPAVGPGQHARRPICPSRRTNGTRYLKLPLNVL